MDKPVTEAPGPALMRETVEKRVAGIAVGHAFAHSMARSREEHDEIYATMIASAVHVMAQAIACRNPREAATEQVLGRVPDMLREAIDDLVKSAEVVKASIERVGETIQ